MANLNVWLIVIGIGEIVISLGVQVMPIHPSWWLSGSLCLIGLVLILVGTIRYWKANRRLCDIPEIISGMHERLTLLVEQMPPLTKTELETFVDDYLELLGLDESRYPELKQITPMSDIKAKREVIGAVLDRWLSTLTEMEDEDIKSLFIKIGGLMNVRGTGISQMRAKDKQYARLKRRLAKVQPEIPPELNAAIDNYLQFSFGSLSLYRLKLAVPYGEIINALPPKYSAEIGVSKERMDTMMNELLAKVRSIIQRLTHEIADSPSTSHRVDSRP